MSNKTNKTTTTTTLTNNQKMEEKIMTTTNTNTINATITPELQKAISYFEKMTYTSLTKEDLKDISKANATACAALLNTIKQAFSGGNITRKELISTYYSKGFEYPALKISDEEDDSAKTVIVSTKRINLYQLISTINDKAINDKMRINAIMYNIYTKYRSELEIKQASDPNSKLKTLAKFKTAKTAKKFIETHDLYKDASINKIVDQVDALITDITPSDYIPSILKKDVRALMSNMTGMHDGALYFKSASSFISTLEQIIEKKHFYREAYGVDKQNCYDYALTNEAEKAIFEAQNETK